MISVEQAENKEWCVLKDGMIIAHFARSLPAEEMAFAIFADEANALHCIPFEGKC